MDQQQCLASPHHYTRYGVCYVGSNVTIPIHGITIGGGTAPTSVPEPSTAALFALALVLGVLSLRIRPRGDTKLG